MFNYFSLQPQGSEPILPVIASSGLSADDYEGSCGFGFGIVIQVRKYVFKEVIVK